MTNTTLSAILNLLNGDQDAIDAFTTVCINGGAISPAHFAFQCDTGRNAALDRGSDRWAAAYARVKGASAAA